MIVRRDFIRLLSGAAAWPLAARAQQLPVIGFLIPAPSGEATRDYIDPTFYEGLAESGFIKGRNVRIEYLGDNGHSERQQVLAADAVRRRVSLIVAVGTGFAQIAKAATQTIPIVFLVGGDPVGLGLVTSHNRPGGNVTGVALQSAEIMGKRLELLHKLVPGTDPIGIFVGAADDPLARAETRILPSAGSTLGIKITVINVADASDLQQGFAKLIEKRPRALLLGSNVLFEEERNQIISHSARERLPTMFYASASAVAGAFASYGPDLSSAWRQFGNYTGRILKGERPADLPVVQPTKFELVINLKTAKAFGIEVPPTLSAIADEIIE
jgi:putative ABC transport system substrate-binding protein